MNSAVTLSPATLPAGTVNVAYSQAITAGGGTGAKTLTVSNIQNAVAGLVVPGSGSNTLSISGTPTATGTETFTVTATDSLGATTVGNYSITVNSAVTLSPATLPAGTVNVAYSQAITAGGGTGAKTLTVSNIQNAVAGLIVPGSGSNTLSISGTPTATGTETFTVTATDSLGATTVGNYSITVNSAVTLSPATLPAGTVNVAYSQAITAGGGTGAKTLTVSNIQNAVAGLIVPGSGSNTLSISGTPTATGTETFTVTATDSLGATTVGNYSITVNSAVTLSPATLPAGTVNVAYSQAITAGGGTGAKTLTVSNIQNAVAGLIVPGSGSNTLSISGTPTATGTETFTVTATDSLGATTVGNYSITVNSAVTLSPATLPAGTVNVAYSQAITAGGGTGAKTLTVSNIQNAVAGLVVPGSGSNTLSISGTPTATGTETFTVTATDSLGATTVGNYSITVNSAVTLSPATLPAGTVNVAYSQAITAGGGTGAKTLTVSNIQNAVAGLVVPGSGSNTLSISGTPTATGTETFTVTATDSLGATTVGNYSITVNSAVTLSPATLPAGTVNVAYSQAITAGGGTGAKTLTVSNIQNAVAGLVVPGSGSNTLSISGTPTATGTETFTVTATDSLGATTVGNYSITVNSAVTLSPATLPAGTVNVAYSQAITAGGGTGAKTLTVSNIQNAVAGLIVPGSGSNTLSISGTPTATGTETFTVTATDSLGATTVGNYSITVNSAVTLSPATLPAGTVNVAYSQAITAGGGTGAKTLTVSNIQNAVAGLIVPGSGSNTLSISGTPTATGTETFTVTATDSLGATTVGNYSITVNNIAGPATHFVVSAPSLATAGTAFSFTVTAEDQNNSTATGYTGTVHFTSSDIQAALPSDYTFLPADNGVHTFLITLNTSGPRSITAVDTVTGTITGSQAGIIVNQPPSAEVTTPTSPQSGNVSIAYSLKDVELNTCSITVEYSKDEGATWHPVTPGPGGDGTTGLASSPIGLSHSYVWASGTDIFNSSTYVQIRVTPSDTALGTPGTSSLFFVNNPPGVNQSPSVVVATPTSPQSGNVTISYELTDAESETCSIAVQYSTDGSWHDATPGPGGHGTTGLTSLPTGSLHTFVWASGNDLFGASATVEVRIRPSDGSGTGDWGTTNTFAVSNLNAAPERTAGTVVPISVAEDSANTTAVTLGLEAFRYGPGDGADEASQTLTYTVTAIPSYVHLFKADGTTPVSADSPVTAEELQGLKYKTVPDANGTGSNVTWTVTDDGAPVETLTENLPITVTAVNDAPVLSGIEAAALAYTENAAATAVTSTIVASDVDNANLAGATIQIGTNYQNGQDVLSFTNTATITGTWTAATGTLVLSGSDTVANYQAALRAVKYQNTSENPSTVARTVTFKVNDGTLDSSTVSRNIAVTAVHDAPVLSGIEAAALAYTENAAATAVTSTIVASDVDNANLAGATIQIGTNYQNGQDVLSFTNTATITGTWTAATGTLALSGSDTVANYQAALRAVKYQNTSENPSTVARTVTFKVNDGELDSIAVSRNIAVTAVNDAPVLSGIEAVPLTYTKNAAATPITSTISVNDVDNVNLAGATVLISTNYQNGQDVLSFTNTATITGTWTAATGTMVLSGSDTVANYQAALRAVKYQNTSATPSTATRTVTFKVNDGTLDSNTPSRNIAVTVDEAPVLSGIEAATLTYTENDPATAITSAIVATDSDSANLAGATIQIGTNYQNGQDVLSFTNTATITGTWTAATGTLALSGSDTVANYQAALRAVKYQNTSDNPSTLVRTVTLKVNDGTLDSIAVSRNITVTAVNDAPVLSGIEAAALAYTENAAATAVTSTIVASDVDNANLAGATIQIGTNYQNGQDVLSFTNTATITGTWTAATGTLVLSGSDTVANYQAALRAVKYQNTSENPSTVARTATFKVNDGTLDSSTVSRNIAVTAVHDAPVLSGIEAAALAYTENAAATAVTSTIVASDVDNANLAGATIQIGTNYQNGQDVLSFTNTASITGTWTAATGTLALSGSDTVANYQAALRAVKYQNTSDDPNTATRTVTFKVNDGELDSIAVSRNIAVTAVNDAPVLSGIEAVPLTYTKNAAATPITSTISVNDVDNVNLAGATVLISTNYQNGQDVLSFTSTATITGTWTAATGTMVLSGSDTVANYQAALRAVKYQNTSATPSTATRTVTFKVNDGTLDSNTPSRNIAVTVDEAPVLSGIEAATLTYTENDPATAITSAIVATDSDSANLAGATIQIGTNYQNGQDVLSFTNTATITGTWTAATGTLALSGSDTVANYQAALRAVKYQNTSDNPSTLVRTVTLKVNDGTLDSIAVSRNIAVTAVNDAPVLSGIEAAALAYTANAPATAVTSTIVASDVDNANLAGATIQITTNYQNGQDVLSFTNTATITGTWTAATGTLVLSGSDTVANYQAALRAVKYLNTSANPNTAPRTVTFTLSDGTSWSIIVSRTITVTAVHAAPVLSGIEGTALTYTENAAATAVTSTIVATDSDSANLTGATIQIGTNYQNGQDVLSFTNTATITGTWTAATGTLVLSGSDTVANYQAALRAVKYQNTSDDPNTATRTVTFKVNDGALDSTTVSRTIAVTAVNDAPVLSGIETATLTYTANAAATPITSTIVASDVDNANLAIATIQIGTNYQNGQDVLLFTSTTTITGTWTPATGTMVLSGSDTVANYQAALRAVKYQNTSATPNTATRTVTFKVNDGTLDSNTPSRNIAVNLVGTGSLSGFAYLDSNNDGNYQLVNGKYHAFLPGVTLNLTGTDSNGKPVSKTTTSSTTDGSYTFSAVEASDSAGYTITEEQPSNFRDGKTTAGSLGGTAGTNVISAIKVGAGQQGTSYNFGERGLVGAVMSLRMCLASTPPVSQLVSQLRAAPVVTLNASPATFVSGTVAIASGATVTHADGPNAALTSLVVTVTNPKNGSNETLTAVTTNTHITATSSASVLTLSGIDTAQHYQDVLRTVTYANSATNPNTTARLISFMASDSFKQSNRATTTVAIGTTGTASATAQAVDQLMAGDSWNVS